MARGRVQHLLTCPGSVHLRVMEKEGQYNQDQDDEGEDEDCIEDQVEMKMMRMLMRLVRMMRMVTCSTGTSCLTLIGGPGSSRRWILNLT